MVVFTQEHIPTGWKSGTNDLYKGNLAPRLLVKTPTTAPNDLYKGDSRSAVVGENTNNGSKGFIFYNAASKEQYYLAVLAPLREL